MATRTTQRNGENVSELEENNGIKAECDVNIKWEPNECTICSNRSLDSYDIFITNTTESGTSLFDFLFKLTNVKLGEAPDCSKYVCKSCLDLINVLEQAEIEYIKLKKAFEELISKNPLFYPVSSQVETAKIKNEVIDFSILDFNKDVDSEDEPLSNAKKKQNKNDKPKKKMLASRRKVRSRDSWQCTICNEKGDGGKEAEVYHQMTAHPLTDVAASLEDRVKEEDVDGSQSPISNNGYDSLDADFKLPLSEDDDSSSCLPIIVTHRGRVKGLKGVSITKRKKAKVLHHCDQCDAKYTSLLRLKHHKEKHESKPPYICEVCGANYKHKRACDIHVAMHKGISDWKCEECNKIFPSKGALHRHNNIHTGKSNYQCDLCGKSFIHLSSFKMHKLAHSGVKPHKCDVCGLALMTRSHLKRHKRVHTGEKRHECTVCGKRFSERYNLVAHSKSHEPGAAPDTPPAPRRRLFRCPYCQERFERQYLLERHTSSAHGRVLERPPATPRNTMSKLLKAQAHARRAPAPAPPAQPAQPAADVIAVVDIKEDRSPEPTSAPSTPQKSNSSVMVSASGAWQGPFTPEYRHEFTHSH